MCLAKGIEPFEIHPVLFHTGVMPRFQEKPRMIRVNADGTPYTGPTSAKQAIHIALEAGKAVAAKGGTKAEAEAEMDAVGLRLAKQMSDAGFMLIAGRVHNTFSRKRSQS